MIGESLAFLWRSNLALSLATLVVLALRGPVRRRFGLQRAYLLWLAPPLAFLGGLMPASPGSGAPDLWETVSSGFSRGAQGSVFQIALGLLWFCGVVLSLILVVRRHAQFVAEVRSGRAGPAVVGVMEQRFVAPADFKESFAPAVQRLVRAHERAHMDRFDTRTNGVLVVVQCLFWFNPLIHLAARAIRLDQELACDAAVVERFPAERRAYAEALFHAHQRSGAPLACHWVSGGGHPLVVRVAALANRSAPSGRDGAWIAVVFGLCIGSFTGAWASESHDRRFTSNPIHYVDYVRQVPADGSRTIWRIAASPG